MSTFVKQEVTFGKGHPRAVCPREPGIRSAVTVCYRALEKQVYQDIHMVKHQNQNQILNTMCSVIPEYTHAICMDIGSYDSAQRGMIWEIEEHLVRTIAGNKWLEAWRAACLNPTHIK